MGVSEFAVVGVFGAFGFVLSVVIPIVAIVLLVKILGRLDDISRRLDAAERSAPAAGSRWQDRPADTVAQE